jgi:AhpD family alkylhydroperoxidase
VDRETLLQVSFAVSMANGCRYCTLHQVQGLRRLGVSIDKLVAMRKDDSALTPKELVAVEFARKSTRSPSSITDADYDRLVKTFGDRGALDVLLQTCNFAFMNRFTDNLGLPSEDEAVKTYREVYGTDFQPIKGSVR